MCGQGPTRFSNHNLEQMFPDSVIIYTVKLLTQSQPFWMSQHQFWVCFVNTQLESDEHELHTFETVAKQSTTWLKHNLHLL